MVGVLDYGAGNLQSVVSALEALDQRPVRIQTPGDLQGITRLVFPGVGHASSAKEKLQQNGLWNALKQFEQPVLGICLGMQLMAECTEEGNVEGLHRVRGEVRRFTHSPRSIHTGWNTVESTRGKLFDGIPSGSDFYFVHGYYLECSRSTTATTSYGNTFSASVQTAASFGVQFHPEKSGAAGLRLLQNFLSC